MVYSKQFVAVITLNGKILRESRSGQEDVVQMPFNSEFGIRLKNLSSNRAAIGAEIDGKDILDGQRIVLGAGETHDLEGFMENGVVRNRLKFIQKTKEIAEYRGDFISDGIIKITHQFENPYTPPTIYPSISWPYDPFSPRWPGDRYWNDYVIGNGINEEKTGGPIYGTIVHYFWGPSYVGSY